MYKKEKKEQAIKIALFIRAEWIRNEMSDTNFDRREQTNEREIGRFQAKIALFSECNPFEWFWFE